MCTNGTFRSWRTARWPLAPSTSRIVRTRPPHEAMDMWLEQKVTAIDGTPEAWFGSAVAISGDTALVGAFNSIVDGKPGQGAVYAFRKVGDAWQQVQKLVADDG